MDITVQVTSWSLLVLDIQIPWEAMAVAQHSSQKSRWFKAYWRISFITMIIIYHYHHVLVCDMSYCTKYIEIWLNHTKSAVSLRPYLKQKPHFGPLSKPQLGSVVGMALERGWAPWANEIRETLESTSASPLFFKYMNPTIEGNCMQFSKYCLSKESMNILILI